MLSVNENLEFITQIYGFTKSEAKEKATKVMNYLNLLNREFDTASKLSGGLMRRLSIGMALITDPKLIFLDEPTLGVEIVSRRELWHILRELKKESVSIILTTHHLEEANSLCDRIAIMTDGQIKAIGTPSMLIKEANEETFENAFLKITGNEIYINEE